MKSVIYYTILSILPIVSLISCEYNVLENQNCNPDISFSEKIQPIIGDNCFQCHDGNQSPNLSTYTGIKENAQKIKTEIQAKTMPQEGSLTQVEIESITCWIDNGALNN